jgi:outer membrane receptor protein involved in Fe transport
VAITAGKDAEASIRRQTSIAAQGLAPALRMLAKERDVQLVYRTELVGDQQTIGAAGDLTLEEALTQLLSGTGLAYRYIEHDAITIVPNPSGTSSAPFTSTERDGAGAAGGEKGEESAKGGDGKEGTQGKGPSQSIRLTQVEQGAPSKAASSAGGDKGFSRTNPNSDAGSGSAAKLEEIMVTATRRSEGVLEVPLSITALTTDSLVKSNIKSVDDLSTLVPGITFQSTTSLYPALTNISIRGITSASGDPTTGIYLDDIAISEQGNPNFGTPLPAFFDLERVEVLRGPQGTLFGAGAMGGAVRFIQNQPGLETYTGRATGEIGFTENGGTTYEAGAAFGGPIVEDKLGFRASVWQRRDGGYIDRFDPIALRVADPDANRVQRRVGRLAVTWAPSDAVKITPSYYWQDLMSPGVGVYHLAVSDPREGEFRNGAAQRTPMADRFAVSSVSVQADLGFANLTAVSAYLTRTASSVGDLTASFGARAFLFGIPGSYGNPLGAGFPASYDQFQTTTNGLKRNSFTQEVRLSSIDPDAWLAWTAGAYYDSTNQLVTDRWSGTPFDFFVYNGSDQRAREKQISAFAQIDLRLAQGLKFTAGVRAARFELDKSQITNPGTTFAEHTVNKPVNPKVGLEYQVDSRNLFYVSAGKGFRDGGVNLGLPKTPLCQVDTAAGYGPDSLWSYEIGTKNRLFGDRATFVASAFHVKWSDIQTAINLVNTCGGTPVVNAGTASVNGFDVALSVPILPALRADLSAAYSKSKFTSSVFTDAGGAVALNGYVLSSAAAPWSVTESLEYSFQVHGREAFVRAEDVYRARSTGPFIFDVPGSQSYNPDLRPDPGWNLLNLRTGIQLDKAQLAVFVTNALNARPTLGWDNRVMSGTFVYAHTISPRTMGLNVNYKF